MKKVNPIPENYQSLIPYIYVNGADKAIEFYTNIFGAEEKFRMASPDPKKIGHAELVIGNCTLMLADEMPEYQNTSPLTLHGTPFSFMVYVEDVDSVFQKALDAGAKVLHQIENKFYGDRTGTFVDPFGHHWMVATHIEDVSLEEARIRGEKAALKMKNSQMDAQTTAP